MGKCQFQQKAGGAVIEDGAKGTGILHWMLWWCAQKAQGYGLPSLSLRFVLLESAGWADSASIQVAQKRHYFALYRRMLIIAVIIFVTAAGVLECWAADRRAVKSLLEIRRENVTTQEWDLSCGAAALATILKYQYGDPVSEKDIGKALISRKEYIENPELVKIRQGFSLLDLKRYVDNRGYRGIGYGKLTFANLVEKAPIMVPVDFLGYSHFVVFRGVMEDRVLFADPGWGNRTMPRGDFENAWIDYGEAIGKVGFVVERQNGTLPLDQLSPKASDFVMLR